MKKVELSELKINPFNMIGEEWMLIAAKKENQVNTMTASWGGFGVIWGKNVVYVFIRKSRYTKEFVDQSDSFSISFYNETYRKELSYLGSHSGRDEDKIKHVGFHVEEKCHIPYFKEAQRVFLCKKLSRHTLDKEGIIDETILPKCYPNEDYHDLYIGEIIEVLEE